MLESVARWDEDVYANLAGKGGRRADAVLPALSRVADYSVLWMGIAAAMRAFGGRRARRAAARGVATVTVSSLITNQGLKRLNTRARPDHRLVPLRRKAKRMPTSVSFPSGHSASAAAFATAVALEAPPLGLALGGLALGVGLSRVTTGTHYPSDVIAGFAVGVATALAGTKIVPPLVPVLGDDSRPRQERAVALPEGAGLTVIVNDKSGADRTSPVDDIRAALPRARIAGLDEHSDLIQLAEQALADGALALGVCGGDGTVLALAEVAIRHQVPLAVFPGGTFNHFAKDARVSTVADTAEGVLAGLGTWVDVGTLNDRIFLNTASVGSYPEFVTERESLEPRYGKRLAAVLAARHLLDAKPRTRLRVDGMPVTSMLFFVGNGQYEPRDFAPALRPRLDGGKLDLRILVSDERALTVRLLWATLTGRLERSTLYLRRTVSEIDVEILESADVLVSRDGEVDEPATGLRFGVRRRALFVYQPPDPGL